jgi:hypothetical protein
MINLIKLLFIYLYTIFYISCISTVDLLKEVKNNLKQEVISNNKIIKNKKRN